MVPAQRDITISVPQMISRAARLVQERHKGWTELRNVASPNRWHAKMVGLANRHIDRDVDSLWRSRCARADRPDRDVTSAREVLQHSVRETSTRIVDQAHERSRSIEAVMSDQFFQPSPDGRIGSVSSDNQVKRAKLRSFL